MQLKRLQYNSLRMEAIATNLLHFILSTYM